MFVAVVIVAIVFSVGCDVLWFVGSLIIVVHVVVVDVVFADVAVVVVVVIVSGLVCDDVDAVAAVCWCVACVDGRCFVRLVLLVVMLLPLVFLLLEVRLLVVQMWLLLSFGVCVCVRGVFVVWCWCRMLVLDVVGVA